MASVKIEFQNVSMSFDGERVLQGINFKIQSGEKFIIVGPSGEGKSVLLKLMSGILKPTSGRVLIEGIDLNDCEPKTRTGLMLKMGMVFQKNALFDSLTCLQNVTFPLIEVTDIDLKKIEDRAHQFLDDVGIYHAKDLYPDEISGGMQKRLGIARALALLPEIMFYDDPTAGLDPITSRIIIDLIMRLQEHNDSTVIAVTNDMNRAYQLADRVAMVVDSSLIITGSPGQTRIHGDPRVQQFIQGKLDGPLTAGSHT